MRCCLHEVQFNIIEKRPIVFQEAVCVGMKAAMTDDDAVITAYRAHGWTHMMGVPILGVLAELAGKFILTSSSTTVQ